jgi:hypothetical protein
VYLSPTWSPVCPLACLTLNMFFLFLLLEVGTGL